VVRSSDLDLEIKDMLIRVVIPQLSSLGILEQMLNKERIGNMTKTAFDQIAIMSKAGLEFVSETYKEGKK